jgi:hypothetical protein
MFVEWLSDWSGFVAGGTCGRYADFTHRSGIEPTEESVPLALTEGEIAHVRQLWDSVTLRAVW